MFDLKVQIVDPKTGKTLKHQPYKLIIKNGIKQYLRDGVMHHEDGTPVESKKAEKADASKGNQDSTISGSRE